MGKLKKLILILAIMVSIGVEAKKPNKNPVKNFTEINGVEGDINKVKLLLYSQDTVIDLNKRRPVLRMAIQSQDYLVKNYYPQSFKIKTYVLDSSNQKQLISISGVTISSAKNAESASFNVPIDSLKTSQDLYFEVYDSSNIKLAVFKYYLEIVQNQSSNLPGELSSIDCEAGKFGNCQLKYIFDNVKFEAVPVSNMQTQVYKELNGTYTVSIPVVQGKLGIDIETPITSEDDEEPTIPAVDNQVSNGIFEFINEGKTMASVAWNKLTGSLDFNFADQDIPVLNINKQGRLTTNSLKLNSQDLSENPQDGLFEFDGNKLYFTKNGARTELGLQGPPGPAGAMGPVGAQGPAGASGSFDGSLTEILLTAASTTFTQSSGALTLSPANGSHMLIDLKGNSYLGVNTSSPDSTLTVVKTDNSDGAIAKFMANNLSQGIIIGYNNITNTTNYSIRMQGGGGNLGVYEGSPSAQFHVQSSSASKVVAKLSNPSGSTVNIFEWNRAGGQVFGVIDNGGRMAIGKSSVASGYKLDVNGQVVFRDSGYSLIINPNNSATGGLIYSTGNQLQLQGGSWGINATSSFGGLTVTKGTGNYQGIRESAAGELSVFSGFASSNLGNLKAKKITVTNGIALHVNGKNMITKDDDSANPALLVTTPGDNLGIKYTNSGRNTSLNISSPGGAFMLHGSAGLQLHSGTGNMSFTTDPGTARITILQSSGNVGIGTSSPQQKLHISDVMRLEPRSSAPSSPSLGDIYVDSDSNELCFYDGSSWTGLKSGGACS